jgi:transposase
VKKHSTKYNKKRKIKAGFVSHAKIFVDANRVKALDYKVCKDNF